MKDRIADTKREYWIDIAKLLAILGVLTDHTNGVLYSNQFIANMSYFSVSLFILIMGITTFWSMEKSRDTISKKLIYKSWGILRPYLVATFIYYIAINRSFDFETYINCVLNFNISGPFYYVFLYMQLIIVTPIVYSLFKVAERKPYGWFIEILFFGVILVVSSWTTNHTNILSIYGGGGKLFGGSYLALFYIGMWFAKYYRKIQLKIIPAIIVFVLSTCLTIFWVRFFYTYRATIDGYLPFGGGFNPPSLSFCTYAILLAISLYSLDQIRINIKCSKIDMVFQSLAFIGKRTLYVFLYHRFFLDIIFINFRLLTGYAIENIWCKRIVYFGFMLFGSMLLEVILERIHRLISVAYRVKTT